jgi:hypothetical protein
MNWVWKAHFVHEPLQSNLHITTLDYTTTLTIWHISGRPNFLVLIYLHITTMTLIIRHFLGPICHIIEVINVHKWWDPLIFKVPMWLVLWEHAMEPLRTSFLACVMDYFHNVWYGEDIIKGLYFIFISILCDVVSRFLQYNCSFILMYLHYVYIISFYI